MSLEYFDDDGDCINPDFIKMPSLSVICRLKDDSAQEPMCNLNRLDQDDEETFECDAYIPMDAERPQQRDDSISF